MKLVHSELFETTIFSLAFLSFFSFLSYVFSTLLFGLFSMLQAFTFHTRNNSINQFGLWISRRLFVGVICITKCKRSAAAEVPELSIPFIWPGLDEICRPCVGFAMATEYQLSSPQRLLDMSSWAPFKPETSTWVLLSLHYISSVQKIRVFTWICQKKKQATDLLLRLRAFAFLIPFQLFVHSKNTF